MLEDSSFLGDVWEGSGWYKGWYKPRARNASVRLTGVEISDIRACARNKYGNIRIDFSICNTPTVLYEHSSYTNRGTIEYVVIEYSSTNKYPIMGGVFWPPTELQRCSVVLTREAKGR